MRFIMTVGHSLPLAGNHQTTKVMTLPFYTIGHSTRTMLEFADLLRVGQVDVLVDIRKLPGSRKNPQFNEDALAKALSGFQIRYQRIATLGGLRGRKHEIPSEVNGWWENRSFHNYADYALSSDFRAGLDDLIRLGRDYRTAMMCSEAVWWRCHRRIIADHLIAAGGSVFHLMAPRRAEPACLSAGASVLDGTVTYPARASQQIE